MILLIFFALPLATVLLTIVFEKILKSPILVAITFFSVYLIILFALYATDIITNLAVGLIAIIVYTIMAFITAYLIKTIRTLKERIFDEENNNFNNTNDCLDNENLLEMECRGNNVSQIDNNGIALSGNIIPNQNNGGRTGNVRGCYRRF